MNIFRFNKKVLIGLVLALTTSACGTKNDAGMANQAGLSSKADPADLAALNSLSRFSSEISIIFYDVESVLLLPIPIPFLCPPNAACASGLARVDGPGEILSGLNSAGNTVPDPIRNLDLKALFSDSTNVGDACYKTALAAKQQNRSVRISGKGVLVPRIAADATADVSTQSADLLNAANATVTALPPISPPPPFESLDVTVVFQSIDDCQSMPLVP